LKGREKKNTIRNLNLYQESRSERRYRITTYFDGELLARSLSSGELASRLGGEVEMPGRGAEREVCAETARTRVHREERGDVLKGSGPRERCV
jgi:hypothetical protein